MRPRSLVRLLILPMTLALVAPGCDSGGGAAVPTPKGEAKPIESTTPGPSKKMPEGARVNDL